VASSGEMMMIMMLPRPTLWLKIEEKLERK
jgi:hypothetical protein